MLRKLLKYDFRAVIKLWSIGALAVLVLSVCDGFCAQAELTGRDFPGMVQLMLSMVQMLSSSASMAFYVMNILLLSLRFYKNFFTDEGYLTFTLPVQRHTLLNSKLIVSLVMMFATFWLCVLGSYLTDVITRIGLPEVPEDHPYYYAYESYSGTLGSGLLELIKEYFVSAYNKGDILWAILYAVEFILITVLSTLFSILFMSNCITFGSIVAKRGKVAASIGIYFGANFVFTIITFILILFTLPAVIDWFDYATMETREGQIIVALLLLLWAGFRGLMCSLLYALQYRLLDRKLNLP